MGQEISNLHFKHCDFHHYDDLLHREMRLLRDWFAAERFSDRRGVVGVELEAWLVDPDGVPTPWNEQVIARTGLPDVVPELARYNVEFNVPPKEIRGRGLEELIQGLEQSWKHCDSKACELGSSLVAIGLLPTLEDSMLSVRSMSKLRRYHALNEQVLRLRQGRAIQLRLEGRESLASDHRDVMLESATTSFQLHLQVPMHESVWYYNASMIASAPLVAITANAPYLFGKDLWVETRIPLFEQSVDLGTSIPRRVTFGSDYAVGSLEEVFMENILHHPVLLPLGLDDVSDRLAHVRLLNGTIWRWNRPLIGFNEDGTPHLRIEQRVMPAGPTMQDMAANMALYYGLVESLAHEPVPPEKMIPFEHARDNFYRAARHGMDTNVRWLDRRDHSLKDLFLEDLLPRAAFGLQRLQVDPLLVSRYLQIIEDRVRTGQTGAVWQRSFTRRHGREFGKLLRAYRDRQRDGEPIHTWDTECNQVVRATTNHPPLRRSMLHVKDRIPEGLLQARANELAGLLKQPTLIHLPGRRRDVLFVSIVLHGNEDVGLLAMQRVLKKYIEHPLPRSLSLFIGNVEAARTGVRHLDDQPDYNRIWPGTERDDSPEHAVMRHVMFELQQKPLFASVDLHNNTGWNPMYSCICDRTYANLQLASLFGRTAVYFRRPTGVQTMAFTNVSPAITCECGKVGDEAGVNKAVEFIDACLHLAEIPNHPVAEGDLNLFHTVATLRVPERVVFEYGDECVSPSSLNVDLRLRSDLDHLNFQELESDTVLGWCASPSALPLVVVDESGANRTDEYLRLDHGNIRLRQSVTPAMLTCNSTVVRQDCLGYFMESIALEPD